MTIPMIVTRWRAVRRGRLLRLEAWAGDEPADGELFQERLREDPFWMLVACQLVNLTTWAQARPCLEALMQTYRTPAALSRATEEDLHPYMMPLGLWRRRTTILLRFSRRWLDVDPNCVKVLSLPGCGKYAADSWAIFVEGRTDVMPTDGKLSWYLKRLKERSLDNRDPDPP